MNIHVGREAIVTNPLKNYLRPLPKIESGRFTEIANGTTVLVLDGPSAFKYRALDIPFWVVRVLEGDSRDRVGWMAEVNQSGKTILVGI
ncbi:MAG: hypothetical protein N2439_06980 [Anaerolineae bacterium]|nr:hypothetical protein [Anaerolineae bacterium]